MNFKKTALSYIGQELTEFPKEIFKTYRLYKLNLSHNKIKTLPKEIEQLKFLETLDLSGNDIRHLYAKLFELPNLKILILKDNRIVSLPKQVERLQQLKILNLANNKLTELPPELSELPNLEELNISGNYLNELPLDGEGAFPQLKALYAAQNPLRSLTAHQILTNLPNLKSFYCYTPVMDKRIVSDDPGIYKASGLKGNYLPFLKELQSNKSKMIATESKSERPIKHPKIFISYSHADTEYLVKLKRHLKVLGQGVQIDVWDDTKIRSSDKWKKEIEKALDGVTTAILLVSTDFLISDFIQNNELPQLLKAAEERGTRIHPVIVQPCQFLKNKKLADFQAANSVDEPLSECSPPKQERIWMKLIDDIQYFLQE